MSLDHLLSFQLYSAREFPPIAAQFERLAALGFTNVEPYGDLYADLDGLKKNLDANGLKTFSGHFDLSMLENDLPSAIKVAKTLGMSLIVAPWLEPEDRPTDAAGWMALGKTLASIAQELGSHGLALAWHNHEFEFEALPDGTFPIELILADDRVKLELDIAWVRRAGADPIGWIERYADRIIAVHVKDVAPEGENLDQDGWTNVGHGIVDWNAAWAAVGKTGARVAVLEHDEPKDWIDFATESAVTVKRLAETAK